MKVLTTIVAFLLLGLTAHARGGEMPNALAVFNAFIARYADENITWRAEQKVVQEGTVTPPGFRSGQSVFGTFIYRPRLFTELALDEKRTVMNDPRLPAFISTVRMEMDGAPKSSPGSVEELTVSDAAKLALKQLLAELPPGARSPQDVVHVVDISAEQLLSGDPITIILP